jgi:hypothetical protein
MLYTAGSGSFAERIFDGKKKTFGKIKRKKNRFSGGGGWKKK